MCANTMTKKKILLAFSGGLDTSAIIPWLKNEHDAEVIAYCSDLGNAPDPEFLESHAKRVGASQLIFEDIREPFVRDFVFPVIRAGAIYQDDYLLGTAIARPIIAERMAHYAKELGATAIAHGATGKGNDQIRFERAWAYLVPEIELIAPWKVWEFKGRDDLLNYLSEQGIPFEAKEKTYSIDTNLYHNSTEGGILESISEAFDPEDIYQWTIPVHKLGNESIDFTLSFKNGMVTAIDGKEMKAHEILTQLNEWGGKHGIGVVDLVESRANGIKSRGIYETPGGTILYKATQALKHVCWGKSLLSFSRQMGQRYAENVYEGLWHSHERYALEAFFNQASQVLEGEIHLRLQGGILLVNGRQSPYSLYDEDLVSFQRDPFGLHEAADGYCRTLKLSSLQEGKQRQKMRSN